MARALSRSSSYADKTRTSAPGWVSRIRRMASMPSIPGIWMSIRTTSGRSTAAVCTASFPLAATRMSNPFSSPMASGQVVLDQELGLDYSRVVHGEQEYEWSRPVHVGDVLSTVPRLAGIRARGPNEFLVIESDITDQSGATVVVARTTLLSRGTSGG